MFYLKKEKSMENINATTTAQVEDKLELLNKLKKSEIDLNKHKKIYNELESIIIKQQECKLEEHKHNFLHNDKVSEKDLTNKLKSVHISKSTSSVKTKSSSSPLQSDQCFQTLEKNIRKFDHYTDEIMKNVERVTTEKNKFLSMLQTQNALLKEKK